MKLTKNKISKILKTNYQSYKKFKNKKNLSPFTIRNKYKKYNINNKTIKNVKKYRKKVKKNKKRKVKKGGAGETRAELEALLAKYKHNKAIFQRLSQQKPTGLEPFKNSKYHQNKALSPSGESILDGDEDENGIESDGIYDNYLRTTASSVDSYTMPKNKVFDDALGKVDPSTGIRQGGVYDQKIKEIQDKINETSPPSSPAESIRSSGLSYGSLPGSPRGSFYGYGGSPSQDVSDVLAERHRQIGEQYEPTEEELAKLGIESSPRESLRDEDDRQIHYHFPQFHPNLQMNRFHHFHFLQFHHNLRRQKLHFLQFHLNLHNLHTNLLFINQH
jgi:hypothetical protein